MANDDVTSIIFIYSFALERWKLVSVQCQISFTHSSTSLSWYPLALLKHIAVCHHHINGSEYHVYAKYYPKGKTEGDKVFILLPTLSSKVAVTRWGHMESLRSKVDK